MARSMQIDFTKVPEGGGLFNKKRQRAGDYKALIAKVEDAKSKAAGDPMWLFTIKVGSGRYPYYCQFKENTLWKIRNLIESAGLKVPKKRVNVNPSLLVNKAIGVTLEDAEYEGKLQSEIASVFPLSELENAEEPDDDEEDSEEEEVDEEDVEVATDVEDEEEEEEPPAAAPAKVKKDKKKKRSAAVEDVSDDELEELDIEDM
jgi:hypothetical protein